MSYLFRKNCDILDEEDVSYRFNDFGNIKYTEGWHNAFKNFGFTRITRARAEEIYSFDEPEQLTREYTYNLNDYLANHINYGLNQLPDHAPTNYAGGTLLVFREHKGGNIKTNYGNHKYMIIDLPKHKVETLLFPVLDPEISFKFEDSGEVVAKGYIGGLGNVYFDFDDVGVSDDMVHRLEEQTGSRTTRSVPKSEIQ